MKLAELSVKNSLLVNLISIFILAVGVYSMLQMRREAFPSVEYDIVTVTAVYPGAPTEDVEKFVTIPIEKELRSVSGIEKMLSKSDEGLSTTAVYVDPGVRNKSKVVRDVERAVDRADLPDEVDDPDVFELATREFPVLEISLSGTLNEFERRRYAELIEDELRDIPGVAQIRKYGWRDREFWVEVDPEKMARLHVTFDEVLAALRDRNVTIPAGLMRTPDTEFNIRTTGEVRSAEEMEGVIIRANDAGHWLRVGDVATVRPAFEEPTTLAEIDGDPATAMVVVKTEQADAIDLVRRVRSELDQIQKTLPPELKLTVTNDFSYYIKRRLGVLQTNGMIGFFLVLLILFLFLDPIPAFMTALGIPVALCLSFLVMSACGVTINLVSMLGLILVLGMLVDDGIIVSENVYRYIEKGLSPKEAAVKGTQEVIAPVTVTILTTFAAFGPLMFMTDIIGKFIKEIPAVVMITLSASLFEAFVILPSHLSDIFRIFKHRHGKNHEKKWYTALSAFYRRCVTGALRKRYLVLLIMVVIFCFTLWVARHKMRFLLFAGEGIESLWIRVEAPKGTPLAKTQQMLRPVEEIVKSLPKEEVENFRSFIGGIQSERAFDPNARLGSHLAQLTVFLTPMQKRHRTPHQIAAEIREKLKDIKGFEKLYTQVPREGPPVGADIEVAIKGKDYEVMQEIAAQYTDFLSGVKGVRDVRISYEFGKRQLLVRVDENKARQYGLSVEPVARTVRAAFKGGVATTIKPEKAEEEIDVLVRYPEDIRNRREAFQDIYVANARGRRIPLSALARVEEVAGVYRIQHLDGQRVVYVTAQVDNKTVTSQTVNQMLQKQFQDLPVRYPGYIIKYTGEYEDQQKSFHNLRNSYLFALFLIFILLVAMFGSLIQPFIVMSAIPFGIIGVILSFWAHDFVLIKFFDSSIGRPLNFFALMGLVGLTGIVVNDSIVLVDFINRLRKKGIDRRTSIVEAGLLRLRPIIMTSVTTIGGLISVAYGIGGGDPFLKPMALAIVWGLTFSTVLTLIGIPCLYAIFDDLTQVVLHRSMVKTPSS